MASADKIQKLFISREWTLSVAESCTGGQLASALTALAGSSAYFLGGVISYHSSLKVNVLGVPKSTIECLGEVSEPVALAMAKGVRQASKSTWAIAITGIAGPGGGTVEKPVGTVCFAVVGPTGEWSETQSFNSKMKRAEIQSGSVQSAVQMLGRCIEN